MDFHAIGWGGETSMQQLLSETSKAGVIKVHVEVLEIQLARIPT